jgi:hypothetical protein
MCSGNTWFKFQPIDWISRPRFLWFLSSSYCSNNSNQTTTAFFSLNFISLSVIKLISQFGCPLSVSFHQCSTWCPILTFISMLLLADVETGETWEPYKKQCSFQNRGILYRKVPSLFSTISTLPISILIFISMHPLSAQMSEARKASNTL